MCRNKRHKVLDKHESRHKVLFVDCMGGVGNLRSDDHTNSQNYQWVREMYETNMYFIPLLLSCLVHKFYILNRCFQLISIIKAIDKSQAAFVKGRTIADNIIAYARAG